MNVTIVVATRSSRTALAAVADVVATTVSPRLLCRVPTVVVVVVRLTTVVSVSVRGGGGRGVVAELAVVRVSVGRVRHVVGTIARGRLYDESNIYRTGDIF